MTNGTVTLADKTPEEAVGDIIIQLLNERFSGGDEQIYETLQPLINVAIRVGLSLGIQAAEDMIDGIADNPDYGAWRVAIENATIEERVVLMEATRQQAIQDRLREMKRRDLINSVLKTALSVAISLLGLLL